MQIARVKVQYVLRACVRGFLHVKHMVIKRQISVRKSGGIFLVFDP